MEINQSKQRVYLDWAAATPLSEAAFSAMKPFFQAEYGNPSSIHKEGVLAHNAIELARESVAGVVQVRPEQVVFTGGGTEGNNMAIIGLIESLRHSGRHYNDMEIVTTRIEHPSVSCAVEQLAILGVGVKTVAVDEEGFVNLSQLQELITEKTVLFTVAYANSEVGVVQRTRSIRKVLREVESKWKTKIYFHVDAAQAPLWLSCQLDKVDADILVLDAGKCCGPKGVGLVVRSHRMPLRPVNFGGGQERGLRPGTENVAGIVGAGVALTEAQESWRDRAEQVGQIRDEAIEYILNSIPQAVLNGPVGENRLANNINISIPGLDTEYATIVLDSKGFAVSTKSACSGAGGGESIVVREMCGDSLRASSTIRLSIGPYTEIQDLQKLTDTLKEHVNKMLNLTH